MSITALFYAYVLGGITFIPLVLASIIFYTIYTSVPVLNAADSSKRRMHKPGTEELNEKEPSDAGISDGRVSLETNDAPRTRKGWLIVRRTFEEQPNDSGYVNFMRTFLDARTKDPKRSRPKDMWYVVLKGKVLYLYEDEGMMECEAAIELSGYDVIVYPEGLLDGELFARRNSICIRPKPSSSGKTMPGVSRDVKQEKEDPEAKAEQSGPTPKKKERARERSLERDDIAAPWFMFIRSNTDMEDWYLALVHASEYPAQTPTLEPLKAIFEPADMEYLVATLDEQPDVIPMRWFNALIGRIFFSYYRTHVLESFIIAKLMKKLSKVKRPVFLSDIVVTDVSLGDKAPTFSKPMLKELTKEGDASMEVHARYKGEVRITVEATATINLGARLKTYTVKLVLAAILREIEGNMLIKVKRPPSNRIWYAFTQMPRIVLDVEPVVSDRQITWSMILSTIESRLKEIIQESVVLPNMDDISFFESFSYIRRGGIWADACRQTRIAVTTIQPTISSTPDTETQDTIPLLSQNIGAEVTEDRGASEPLDQSTSAVATSTDAQTFQEHVTNGLSNGVTQPSRRRSWFSNPAIDESSLLVGQSVDGGSSQAMNWDMRGRAPNHNKVTSTSARSSKSRDGMTDIVSNDPAPDAEDTTQLRPFVAPPERSLSRQSSRDAHLGYDSANSTKSAPERSVPAQPRRTSDAASTASAPSSPPSSLLSTFRTRDRQALKDSAKEVVRKLGVNWGFRKDWNVPARESIDSSDIHAKDSTSGTTRTNYADVRAAVAERREKGKITSSSMTEVTGRGAFGNEVPDVLDASINKDKDLHGPSSLSVPPSPPERQRRSPSRGPATEIDDPPVEDHHTPIFVQPQGKTMTIPGIHASHRGEVMALGYVAPSDKSKNNPTVNSIYRRLMKSPISTDPESSLGSIDALSGASDANEDVAPLTLVPDVERPIIPPPLPPRSNLVSIPDPTNILTSSTDTVTSAPKDDDLQYWAQSESSGREDRLETPTPPPLPPRRIQTST
ncbi:hypothetical protein APHAL10511_005958 [Amanita phalloides]|nr:hypothetical protein APHAL10511_005958 [Amanita phalloides]